jgi:hypothetical protein
MIAYRTGSLVMSLATAVDLAQRQRRVLEVIGQALSGSHSSKIKILRGSVGSRVGTVDSETKPVSWASSYPGSWRAQVTAERYQRPQSV